MKNIVFDCWEIVIFFDDYKKGMDGWMMIEMEIKKKPELPVLDFFL